MTRPVVFFEINGRDSQRLQHFYRELFGWDIEPDKPIPGYARIPPGIGGPEEGIGGAIAPSGDSAYVVLYVQVLDPAQTLAKAESMGGATVTPPFDIPGGPTIARLRDPEGNVIGLVKQ